MVDLVLDDLRRPAGEGLEACLEFFVLPLDFDGLEALCLARAGEGQAALLGVVGAGLFDDDGVEHDHVLAVAVESDDALVDTDHVRRHADAAVLVGN